MKLKIVIEKQDPENFNKFIELTNEEIIQMAEENAEQPNEINSVLWRCYKQSEIVEALAILHTLKNVAIDADRVYESARFFRVMQILEDESEETE